MTFLYLLLLWIIIGNVVTFLHFYVYFRGITNAFEHYKNKNLVTDEELRNVDMLTKSGYNYCIILIISGSLLGPITIYTLLIDFHRFSIKK